MNVQFVLRVNVRHVSYPITAVRFHNEEIIKIPSSSNVNIRVIYNLLHPKTRPLVKNPPLINKNNKINLLDVNVSHNTTYAIVQKCARMKH